MTEQLTLEILTPQRRVLTAETTSVIIPGSQGEMGILPRHIPLVTTVDSGILAYEENGQRKKLAIHYGYAQVHGEKVTVLTEMVELGEEVDVERAKAAEQRAREKLSELVSAQAEERQRMDKYESKLKRAMVRQRLGI